MSDILDNISALRSLDNGAHWFCGKDDAPSNGSSKTSSGTVLPHERKAHAFASVMVFSYDGENAEEPKQFMKDGITRNLLRCEQCLADYYKGKNKMLEGLRDEGFEDEQVDTFSDWLDEHAFERISRGLKRAVDALDAVPESERRPSLLSRSTLLSMYEVLYCEKFMKDEERMASLFDRPFRLCQTHERLAPADLTPALVRFAFSEQDDRRKWALTGWELQATVESKEDFDFALRPGLGDILRRVAPLPVTDLPLVTRFWTAMKDIIAKLNSDLITHGLRNLDTDVCRLTIDHLNIDSTTFVPLMQTISVLVEKSPRDFWDAMGPISPKQIIEGVFYNAKYDETMSKSGDDASVESSHVDSLVKWVKPFMISVQSSNQAPACRQLAQQFLQRLQDKRFPLKTRVRCYEVGLNVLKWVILLRLEPGNASDAVSRAVATDLLLIVAGYLDEIVARIEHKAITGPYSDAIRDLSGDVVKAALTLECRLLRIDHETLAKNNQLTEGSKHVSLGIWKKIVPRITTRATALAQVALPATIELSDLGQFSSKAMNKMAEEKTRFNQQFKECIGLISRVFEEVGDAEVDKIKSIVFDHDEVRKALIAALLSSDETLYEAAMDFLKSMSGEQTREAALIHLFKPSIADIMKDFAAILTRISDSRNFYSCPRTIRTLGDILGILCDPKDGLLRTSELGNGDKDAIAEYWKHQWKALTTIYDMTEYWSREYDKDMMKEFCRDVMQFSLSLFNEYLLFFSATKRSGEEGEKDGASSTAKRQLLDDPSRTMDSIANWLRLRDPYLADNAVTIIKKLIEQLYKNDMSVPDSAFEVVGNVVQDKTKTILSDAQKAELFEALKGDDPPDTVVGLTSEGSEAKSLRAESKTSITPSLATRSRPQKVKSGTIDFAAWSAKAKSGSDAHYKDVVDLSEDKISYKDLRNATVPGLDKYKKKQDQQQDNLKAQAVQRKADEAKKKEAASQAAFIEKRRQEMEEKRRSNAAAAAKYKAQNPNTVAGQTAGGGSALNGLGNMGKDHSMKKSDVFMSSDESGTDDDDGALFGKPSKDSKKHSAKFLRDRQELRDQKKASLNRGPVKKVKQLRSAADMRARLAPRLDGLHRIILSWDVFTRGEFPPGTARNDYRLVTESFRTANDYKITFEPLLLLEAWQGFQQTVEEGLGKSYQLQYTSRLSVDSLVEVSASVDKAEFQAMGMFESDVVILSTDKACEGSANRCLARMSKTGRRRQQGVDVTFRVSPDNNSILGKLSAGMDLYATKLSSLTPLEREYGSLTGLTYYDLCDEITRAIPSPLLSYSDEKLDKIGRMYKLNRAQAKAVQSAVDNDAFTLIQGPPGSGKTKTIVSIVGALLTDAFRKSSKVVPLAQANGKVGSAAAAVNAGSAMKKLLVCAPSNAAVDELVMRLMDGVKTYAGEVHKLNVVRLGHSDKINAKVASVTLDELVSQKMNINDKPDKGVDEVGQAMAAHKEASEELRRLKDIMNQAEAENQPRDAQLSTNYEKVKRRRQELSTRIDQLKDNKNSQSRDADLQVTRVRQQILEESHVLCATLSGSGHDMFQKLKIDFETVIIDEAAQSVELSALIPLKYGCQKCIMVGDPKQLPPTVLSREAQRFQYEQSLFVRMQNNKPDDVHLLDTQYRMHPEISRFPSSAFYDGRLVDGPGMAQQRSKFWHQDPYLGPYRMFDVEGKHESGGKGKSLVNMAEVELALDLYRRLLKVTGSYDWRGKIGIITPYKGQLQRLRDSFKREHGDNITDRIDFNTTDAFQGRESEVIIFSCVRASEGSIGFLTDIRRMNVGITRAKCSLWVLGSLKALNRGEYWRKMIEDARRRHLITDGKVSDMVRQGAKLLKNIETPVQEVQRRASIESPTSPIEGPKVKRAEDTDAMDLDSPPPQTQQENEPKTNGQAEKRKRESVDLSSGSTYKNARVEAAKLEMTKSASPEPNAKSNKSPLAEEISKLKDGEQKETPANIAAPAPTSTSTSTGAKRPVPRGPPPAKREATSVFMKKNNKKR